VSILSIDLIFKIAGIGIIVSVLHSVLKQAGKEDYGYLVTLVGVVVVLAMVLQVVNELFSSIRTMFDLY
jgi:stage III sporulation protein AC